MSKYTGGYCRQAFRILQVGFVILPIAFGLDKFSNLLLSNWSMYLSPFMLNILSNHDQGFMKVVGVIEIIAGLGVIFKPRLFACIISLWLLCIIINLLMAGHYFDVALRDVGLLLGSLALGRLSQAYAKD